MMDTNKLLSTPISELDLSKMFKETCNGMGFKTLGDIVFILPDQLLKTQGFNYDWLGELSRFLDEKGMLYLLQPLPGRSSD